MHEPNYSFCGRTVRLIAAIANISSSLGSLPHPSAHLQTHHQPTDNGTDGCLPCAMPAVPGGCPMAAGLAGSRALSVIDISSGEPRCCLKAGSSSCAGNLEVTDARIKVNQTVRVPLDPSASQPVARKREDRRKRDDGERRQSRLFEPVRHGRGIPVHHVQTRAAQNWCVNSLASTRVH